MVHDRHNGQTMQDPDGDLFEVKELAAHGTSEAVKITALSQASSTPSGQ